MRYWVFVLILVSFGISGILYIRGEFGEVAQLASIAGVFPRAEDITLLFVGDVMLARGVQTQMRKHNDFSYPFRRIARTLRSADFAFGNLEGPISSRGANQGSEYSFRADPRAVEGLKFAGFDVLSLANNHIWDWGTPAFLDTIDTLNGAGIRAVGAGADVGAANAPVILEIHGNSIETPWKFRGNPPLRVTVFAYTNLYPEGLVAGENSPGVGDSRLEKVVEDIRAVRSQVDLVIVSYHWGEEYVFEPSSEQRELARAIIDAGADLIVGHHPHVTQKLEKYKNGWIAYSLGNFVFDQNFSEETMRGLILWVFVRDGEIRTVETLGIQLSPTYQPYMVE